MHLSEKIIYHHGGNGCKELFIFYHFFWRRFLLKFLLAFIFNFSKQLVLQELSNEEDLKEWFCNLGDKQDLGSSYTKKQSLLISQYKKFFPVMFEFPFQMNKEGWKLLWISAFYQKQTILTDSLPLSYHHNHNLGDYFLFTFLVINSLLINYSDIRMDFLKLKVNILKILVDTTNEFILVFFVTVFKYEWK